MAASTTVFSTTPLVGLKLGATATSAAVATANQIAIPALTTVHANDGHRYIYAKATVAIGSIGTCKISNAGSATTDSGSAGWTANCPGGVAANQFFWAKRTSIN